MRPITTKTAIALGCVALLALLPVLLGFSVTRNRDLNEELIAAVHNNDTQAALNALNKGADPNVRGAFTSTTKSSVSLLDELLASLHNQPAPPHRQTQNMSTVLMLAAQRGNAAVAAEILRRGGDVNATRHGKAPALINAVFANKLGVTQLLLDHGADPNAVDLDGKSALLLACEHGYIDIMKALVKKGANVHVRNAEESTPLILAAKSADEEGIRLLLAHHAEATAHNKKGETALQVAVNSSNPQNVRVVEALLAAGAGDVATVKSGAHALDGAAAHGNLALLKLLLAHGIGKNRADLSTALDSAAARGDLAVLKILKAQGISNNRVDLSMALLSAAREDQFDACRLLLDSGADVNVKGSHGDTPLLLATEAFFHIPHGDNIEDLGDWVDSHMESLVRLLVSHGANVNCQGDYGQTPLGNAIANGRSEGTVAYLLDCHADPNAGAILGGSPLHIVAGYNLSSGDPLRGALTPSDSNSERFNLWEKAKMYRIAELLMAHGANVNGRDKEGRTPLHSAIEAGNKTIVDLLLDHHADINARTRNGSTPLKTAVLAEQKYADLVKRVPKDPFYRALQQDYKVLIPRLKKAGATQ